MSALSFRDPPFPPLFGFWVFVLARADKKAVATQYSVMMSNFAYSQIKFPLYPSIRP